MVWDMNARPAIPASIKAAPRKPYRLLGFTISEGVLFLLVLFGVHLTTYHYSYLLFHTVVELFSIFIATTITVITVNCWSSIENRYISFTGISYLFVGLLDLMHTLSFKGIPIFTNYDYYAPQFWIAARYVESFSLLAGFGLLTTKRRIDPALVTVIYLAITVWLIASILYFKTFPVCFIAGKGLTPFKIVSEYVICAVLTGSAILLYIRRTYFDARVFHQILTALVLMVFQELCFTLFVSDAMSDTFNQIGHLLKICAFYLIYKAIVVTALRDPIHILFRELAVSEARLREAQALAHLGRWELDLDTGAWTWTEEMYRFFSVAESSTPTLGAMLAPLQQEDQQTLRALLARPASLCAPFEFMLRIEAAAGQPRFAQLRGEIERDERGRSTRLLGTLQDVTGQQLLIEGLKESTAQLQERTAALELANQELESFSYSVSHDLRAPLRAIAGFSHILREEYESVLGEAGRRYTETICGNAVRMGQLISDILDFSRLSRREVALTPVDMNGLAREVCEEMRGAAPAERNIVLHIGDLPPVRGDEAMLRQVWVNLISNAIKYSGPRAEAVIEVGSSTDNGENTYWVKDNGVGFDMRYVDKLFGVFQRLHSSQEFEGTGIGLAIVKRIVTRHGGKAWAESELGKGATLYFTLQAMNEEEATPEPPGAPYLSPECR